MEPNSSNMAGYQGGRSAFPPETPVGMAYVPFQKFHSVFEPEVGFVEGTIFPDLRKPFLAGRASDNRKDGGMPNVAAGANMESNAKKTDPMRKEENK